MSYHRNHKERWMQADVKMLTRLLSENTPLFVIRMKLGRSEASVRSAVVRNGLSFRKVNQRPYGRRR